MAKIHGLFGAMTGKVADAVMVIRNGEQIVRKYQPKVSNPCTPGQIASRAKMKLMSQLSAVMAPVIAMPRAGAVSTRNQFVKENYKASTYNENKADIQLTDIKLTKSVVSLPSVVASLSGNDVTARLSGSTDLDVSRVVYTLFLKQPDNTLRYAGSKVVTDAGDNNSYPATFTGLFTNSNGVVYAYGVRDNTESARVAFGNMQANSAETVAKLIVSRSVTETDVTLTETQAAAYSPTLGTKVGADDSIVESKKSVKGK